MALLNLINSNFYDYGVFGFVLAVWFGMASLFLLACLVFTAIEFMQWRTRINYKLEKIIRLVGICLLLAYFVGDFISISDIFMRR